MPEEAHEEGYWKDVHNEQYISQKQAETLLWIFFTKRQPKIGETISAHSKVLF
jgi:hypothetical protein